MTHFSKIIPIVPLKTVDLKTDYKLFQVGM